MRFDAPAGNPYRQALVESIATKANDSKAAELALLSFLTAMDESVGEGLPPELAYSAQSMIAYFGGFAVGVEIASKSPRSYLDDCVKQQREEG